MPHHYKELAEEIDVRVTLMRSALVGIRREIVKLKKEKKDIEKRVGATEGRLKLTRSEEINFRKKLTEMANLETILTEEKDELAERLKKVSERAEKIRRIGEDLEEL